MRPGDSGIRFREIVRFLLSGIVTLISDYTVYRTLQYVNWDLSAAKAGSYVCGTVVGFLLNKWWTFGSRGFSKTEVLRYVMLYVFSACINVGINKAVLRMCFGQTVAYLCAAGVSSAVNFFGQKFFVFVKG